jgi:hypothetical protein
MSKGKRSLGKLLLDIKILKEEKEEENFISSPQETTPDKDLTQINDHIFISGNYSLLTSQANWQHHLA